MSVLAADRARIAEAEAKILDLQRLICPLQQRLDSYKYPVLTLPNEIVSEIFVHFLPVYPLCPPLYGILSPNILTGICRKWREIALSTPALWRAISLDYMGDNAFERQVATVESWLSRSGYCRLSVQMEEDYINNLPVDEILEAIVPHRARWEHMKLLIDLSDLPIIVGPTPLLRQLYITVYGQSGPAPAVAFGAPLLRKVTLTDFEYPAGFLPWSQLTSLTLVATTSPEAWPILTQAANLVHCEMIICGDNDRPPDVTLPRLESLVLWKLDPHEDPLTQCLDSFDVPALHTLQIPEEFLGQEPISTLISFISRARCKLQLVRITGYRCIHKRLYRRLLPSIPKFSFNEAIKSWYSDRGSQAGGSDVESDSASTTDTDSDE
ncbi:hypothetical protein FB451DRAFT_1131043 [Mycena latifolia]|nr:hypothetical protein FB451DRAFT_1131043 [Mycena latifolia]